MSGDNKEKNQNITINLPDLYNNNLIKLQTIGLIPNKSEGVRRAIRDFLQNEYRNLKALGYFGEFSQDEGLRKKSKISKELQKAKRILDEGMKRGEILKNGEGKVDEKKEKEKELKEEIIIPKKDEKEIIEKLTPKKEKIKKERITSVKWTHRVILRFIHEDDVNHLAELKKVARDKLDLGLTSFRRNWEEMKKLGLIDSDWQTGKHLWFLTEKGVVELGKLKEII